MKAKKRGWMLPVILVLAAAIGVLIFLRAKGKNSVDSAAQQTETAQISEAVSPTVLSEPEETPVPEEEPSQPVKKEYHNVTLLGKTVSTGTRMLDLSSIRAEDIAAVAEILPELEELEYANLGDESNGITLTDLTPIFDAAPNVKFAFGFTKFGKELNTYDKVLDLNHISFSDEGAEVRSILPYMRNLQTLDMDSCGVTNGAMAAIRDDYPNIEVIWRIWFGSAYTARTNVTKILASKPSWGGYISDEDAQQLKYCTKLKYLDLGHNDDLSDFSFISELKDLRVAVISMSNCSDLTPFSSCKKLWYLEAGNCNLSDLSPLAECTALEHLNVGTNFDVNDISSLYNLNLKRLWLGIADPVPAEQVAEMKNRHPGIEIDTEVPTGLEVDENGNPANEGFVMGKWKSYKQYLAADWDYYNNTGVFPAQSPKGYYRIVYDGFEYALVTYAYAFESNDPLLYEHDSIYEPTPLPEIVESVETENIIYLTSDTDHTEAWNTLAEAYESETGVSVTIRSTDKDSYGEALSGTISDVDAPTVFELNGAEQLEEYASNCADLSDSNVLQELIYDGFTLKNEDSTVGLAANMDSYGIIVNKKLLQQAGYSVEEIQSFADLKRITEDITGRYGSELGFSAFVVPDMADITDTGFTTLLVNVPISLQFQSKGIQTSKTLDGTYMEQFRDFWNLVMNNCCCSHYDLTPVGYIKKSLQESEHEFCQEEGVFFLALSSEYEQILKNSNLTADDITMIPIYIGAENESGQGLCTGTTKYWCVNANASEAEKQASIDFLSWLVSSPTATKTIAEMGISLPYRNAQVSENGFINQAIESINNGKTPVLWRFSSIPTDAWRDEVNYEMGAWAANLGDWNDIYNEIVNVWGAEYSVK